MKLSDLKCINTNIDLDEYISYREEVKKGMLYPDWLGDFSKEDLTKLLKENYTIWMYKKDDDFVSSMMILPCSIKILDNLGLDIDLKDIISYGPMFVNSKYRGNKLQYQMLQELDKFCIQKNYKYAFLTVHPDNKYSIDNVLKDGFKLIKTMELKRGIRNMYIKELKKDDKSSLM